MPELPDHLDVSVELGGQPLPGAWVELRLPMARKHDYVLLLGPADPAGAISVSRADLENQVSVVQLSGFMDYSSLGVWRGELILRAFDAEAIDRAEERHRVWAENLFEVYPRDFVAQMTTLATRLAQETGLVLEVSATARGGTACVACVATST